jgi:iduronate 2-sulfatase
MHGLANGEVRIKRKDKTTLMKVFQSLEGPDSIYPDGGSIDESLNQLGTLTAEPKPFFLSVGILRPHLPFGAPKKYLQLYEDVELPTTPHPEKPATKTTWHKSSEFMNYDRWGRNPNDDAEFAIEVRKHYAACVSYADAQVGKLLEQLKSTGADKNTIVVLWGDHGWHLGEHAIWGKHTLFEESLLSPLIISHPGIELPGQATKSMVESLDLFPTLCELTGVEKPDFVDGVSLNPILKDPQAAGHAAVAYHRKARTIRTDSKRLILHDGGNIELYDHLSPQRETKNIANEHPEIVKNLKGKLLDRLGGNSQQRTVD